MEGATKQEDTTILDRGLRSRSPSAEPDVQDQKTVKSPWAEINDQDEQHRVVGWRSGEALTASDVKQILKSEKLARHEFKGMQKAANKIRANSKSDPLAGLPPTWQAFYSTVPHLDPQSAYRHFRHEEQRKAKAKAEAEVKAKFNDGKNGLEQGEEREVVEAELPKLTEEAKQKKQLLAEREKHCAEWDKKIARLRALEKDEEVHSRRVRQRLESASYNYGILEGKIRSSDIYFHFLHEDTQVSHSKKVLTLTRANNLMNVEIDKLKNDVRGLLKAAAEAMTSTHASTPKEVDSGESNQKGLSSNEEGLPSASSPSANSKEGMSPALGAVKDQPPVDAGQPDMPSLLLPPSGEAP